MRQRGVRRATVLIALLAVAGCATPAATVAARTPAGVLPDGTVPWLAPPTGQSYSEFVGDPCTASQLRAEPFRWQVSGGAWTGTLRVRFAGGKACLLDGGTSVRVLAGGTPVTAPASASGSGGLLVLRKGSYAELPLRRPSPSCGGGQLEVTFADRTGQAGAGGSLLVPVTGPPCAPGPAAGRLTARHWQNVPAPTWQLRSASAGIVPNGQLRGRPGGTIDFAVRLSNPLSTPVPLTDARYPASFWEYVSVPGAPPGTPDGSVVGPLNTRTVRALPARGSVVYRMRITLPRGAPRGRAVAVTWQLGLSELEMPARLTATVPVLVV